MRKPIYIILIICSILVSCRKKNLHDNQIVRGNVRNNCTGGPFANVRLLFYTISQKSFNKTETRKLETQTDSNGDFEFNIEIVNPDKEKYWIKIPGYSNYVTEFYGMEQEIRQEQLSEFLQFGVSATYDKFFINLPVGTIIHKPDSFFLTFSQVMLHSYEPERIWQFSYGSWDGIDENDNNVCYFCGYPMGWWKINGNMYKNGVNTIIKDSIYLDMGGSATYVVPW